MTTNTATPQDHIEVELPFMGFYETIHDSWVDMAVGNAFTMDDSGQMTAEESDFLWAHDVAPWHDIHLDYARAFTDALAEAIDTPLEYVTMQSPREYNFTTDRIFANMPTDHWQKIRTTIEAKSNWPDIIRERFTSYDGFMSFYSNDSASDDWTRPSEDLDACQTRIYLEQYIADALGEEWEYALEVNAHELDSVCMMPNYEMALAALQGASA